MIMSINQCDLAQVSQCKDIAFIDHHAGRQAEGRTDGEKTVRSPVSSGRPCCSQPSTDYTVGQRQTVPYITMLGRTTQNVRAVNGRLWKLVRDTFMFNSLSEQIIRGGHVIALSTRSIAPRKRTTFSFSINMCS